MERALSIPADSHNFHRRHTQLTRRLALYTYTKHKMHFPCMPFFFYFSIYQFGFNSICKYRIGLLDLLLLLENQI